jgi:hypothetical protein
MLFVVGYPSHGLSARIGSAAHKVAADTKTTTDEKLITLNPCLTGQYGGHLPGGPGGQMGVAAPGGGPMPNNSSVSLSQVHLQRQQRGEAWIGFV